MIGNATPDSELPPVHQAKLVQLRKRVDDHPNATHDPR